MRELLTTNDPVLLSFVEAVLRDARIGWTVLDGNMSALEGSLGILPRRVLVDENHWERAARVLRDAGLSKWISGSEVAP